MQDRMHRLYGVPPAATPFAFLRGGSSQEGPPVDPKPVAKEPYFCGALLQKRPMGWLRLVSCMTLPVLGVSYTTD